MRNINMMVDKLGDIKHRKVLNSEDIGSLLTNKNLGKKNMNYWTVKKNLDNFRNSAEFRRSKSNGEDNSRQKKSTLSRSR